MDKKKAEEEYQKIKKQLDSLNTSPYMKFYEDQQKLISTPTEKWEDPEIKKRIEEIERLSKSLAFSSVLDPKISLDQITDSIHKKDYKETQKLLEKYQSQDYSLARTTLDQFEKTISNPVIQSSLANYGNYESKISDLARRITDNENIYEASKGLAALGKQIASDSLRNKMVEQAKYNIPEPSQKLFTEVNIPKFTENPLPKQNKEIISILESIKGQNDILIKLEKSDQDIQNNSIVLMEQQQSNNEIMINELKSQNTNIEEQLKELKKQNKTAESQIEDNRKSSRNAMIVAIVSVLISALASYMSYKASYDIYNKEKVENDKDNLELLKAINNKKEENEKLSLLLEEFKKQNILLKEQNLKQSEFFNLSKEQLERIKLFLDYKKVPSNNKEKSE